MLVSVLHHLPQGFWNSILSTQYFSDSALSTFFSATLLFQRFAGKLHRQSYSPEVEDA